MEKNAILKRIEYWRSRKAEAVINSSPTIYLAKTGALDFLGIYSRVYMPEKVKLEVVDTGKMVSAPEVLFIENAIDEGMILPGHPSSRQVYDKIVKNPLIHEADAQTIALAHEKKAILVMDDSRGVEVARMMNLEVEPTLTVILIGYTLGIAGYQRTRSIYKTLLSSRFRVSAVEYEKALGLLDILREVLDQ